MATELCSCCTAGAGLLSDRCERCQDFSAFETPCGYSLEKFKGLSGNGKLAWMLSEMAALNARLEGIEDDAD